MPLIDNTTKSRDHVLLQKKKKRKKERSDISLILKMFLLCFAWIVGAGKKSLFIANRMF